jgi:hypothetical protein
MNQSTNKVESLYSPYYESCSKARGVKYSFMFYLHSIAASFGIMQTSINPQEPIWDSHYYYNPLLLGRIKGIMKEQ